MLAQDLSERDLRVIKECLQVAAHGPFFPDWEVETLFGLTRAEMAAIAADWPAVDAGTREVRRAVIGALGHLTGYPHGEEEAWGRYISVSPSEVEDLLRRWRNQSSASEVEV